MDRLKYVTLRRGDVDGLRCDARDVTFALLREKPLPDLAAQDCTLLLNVADRIRRDVAQDPAFFSRHADGLKEAVQHVHEVYGRDKNP